MHTSPVNRANSPLTLRLALTCVGDPNPLRTDADRIALCAGSRTPLLASSPEWQAFHYRSHRRENRNCSSSRQIVHEHCRTASSSIAPHGSLSLPAQNLIVRAKLAERL